MHLLVCISHHGRGHLAQTAPVLNALQARLPCLRLTVRSALPREVLAGRIRAPFTHDPRPADCGFVMHDALRLDVEASLREHLAFHADWPARLAAEADALCGAGVDAVLSNVAYLPLAAARQAGLPAVALCSLNWLDIFRHYLGERAQAQAILAEMRAAYASAASFLKPEPAMPMPDLDNTRPIPPVAEPGRRRREELARRLGLAADDRLVLLGMGGIGYRPPGERWAGDGSIHWLVPDDWPSGRNIHAFAATGMPVADLLASCDAVVTKPGYGTFVEAAAAGIPVVYLSRPDWPETPWLTQWLHHHARAMQIDEAALQTGRLVETLKRLWAQPAPSPVRCEGGAAAARLLMELLD
ncbi:MAG: hypothetical protein ACK4TK_09970 [Thiobacillaceae bacterium]